MRIKSETERFEEAEASLEYAAPEPAPEQNGQKPQSAELSEQEQ